MVDQDKKTFLIRVRDIRSKYYGPLSILGNEEDRNIMLMLLDNLKSRKFRLFLKDKNIENPKYWATINLLFVLSSQTNEKKQHN